MQLTRRASLQRSSTQWRKKRTQRSDPPLRCFFPCLYLLRNTSETACLVGNHVCKYAHADSRLFPVSCTKSASQGELPYIFSVTARTCLREPARVCISCREPASPRAVLQNLGRLLQIERDSAFGYVCKYAPSASPSDLRLTKNLLRKASLFSSFAQYFGNCVSRRQTRMKIRSRLLPLRS